MITLKDRIQEFYKSLFNISDDSIVETIDANSRLKEFFRKSLNVGEDDVAARTALLTANNKKSGPISNERNIYAIYGAESIYTHQDEQDARFFITLNNVNVPNRETLIRIVFSLGMNGKQCNNMLAAAGQYALHKGGNARESIYHYCLEEGRSIAVAEEMYQQFLGLPNPSVSSETEISSPLSQRTKTNANLIDDFLKGNSQQDSDQKDREFVKFLQTLAHTFSQSSGRAWRLAINWHKQITGKQFSMFWGSALKQSQEHINNARTRIKNESTVPCRDYLCLLATTVYFQAKISGPSLLNYVNDALSSCGLGPLMSHQYPDALIIELSRYDIVNCKKNKIAYTSESGIQQVILPDSTGSPPFGIASQIVAAYTTGRYQLIHPLRNMQLCKSDLFFETKKGKKKKIET